MPRLFIAVWPPPELLDALAALPRPAASGIRWTTRDQWHATLRFLGETDTPLETIVARLEDAALTGPSVSAGPHTICLSPTILCVPIAGLEEVAAGVGAATSDIGAPPEDRPYRGHLTVARARRGASVRHLDGAPIAAAWTVEDLAVIESTLNRDGAVYRVVATVGLSHG